MRSDRYGYFHHFNALFELRVFTCDAVIKVTFPVFPRSARSVETTVHQNNPFERKGGSNESRCDIRIDLGCAPTEDMMESIKLEFIGIKIDLNSDPCEDGVNLAKKEFYNRISRGKRFSTSPPSPKEILDEYKAIKAEGYSAIIDTRSVSAPLYF